MLTQSKAERLYAGLKKILVLTPAPKMKISDKLYIYIPNMTPGFSHYIKNLGFDVGEDEKEGDYVAFSVNDPKKR